MEDKPGYLLVELNGQFKILRSKEQLDTLINSLEPKGAREGALHYALTNYRQSLKGDIPVWKEPVGADEDRMSVDGCPSFDAITLFARKWTRPGFLDKQLRMQSDWLDQLKIQLASIEFAAPPDAKSEFDRSAHT